MDTQAEINNRIKKINDLRGDALVIKQQVLPSLDAAEVEKQLARAERNNNVEGMQGRMVPFIPADKEKRSLSSNKSKMHQRAMKKLQSGGHLTKGQFATLVYASKQTPEQK